MEGPKGNEVPRPSGPSPPGTIRDESRTGVTARWAFRRVRERPRTGALLRAFGLRLVGATGLSDCALGVTWAFGLRPSGRLVGLNHPPLLGTSMNCSGKA